MNQHIDVSEKTRERYDRKKAEMDAADPNLPDLSNDQFMKCLLDTVEAVENGLYDDCGPPQEELAE